MSSASLKRRGPKPGSTSRRWTATEDAQLKQHARTMTAREIGRALRRNTSSVAARARKLGVDLRLTPQKRTARKAVATGAHTEALRKELRAALGATDPERDGALANLSAEDRFVAQQILAGVTSTDIAERRGVGVSAVCHQIKRLVQQLRADEVVPPPAVRAASTPAHLLGQAKNARLRAVIDAARIKADGEALAIRKEQEAVAWALREAGGEESAAAQVLGVSLTVFRRLRGEADRVALRPASTRW
ncbi:MAG: hypothetical protein HY369_02830 [Candidatus Aenigmarchaeota archaeon]|nr:hypothetical protein [Candidatus Aenigmarchaeota archaeon]